MRSRTVAGIGLVVLLAAAAIGVLAVQASDEDDTARPVTAAAPSAATASTTVPAPAGPPPLETTGEDWDRIVRSLSARLNWAYEHPDPALVDDYATATCRCYAPLKSTLAALAEKGHYEKGGDVVQSVRLSEILNEVAGRPVQVVAYAVIAYAPTSKFDRTGAVVQSAPGRPPLGYSMELLRGADDRWRVNSTTCLGLPGSGGGC